LSRKPSHLVLEDQRRHLGQVSWFLVESIQADETVEVLLDGRNQLQETVGVEDAAVDVVGPVVAAAAAAAAAAVGAVACLDSVGNLPLRDAWRLQRNLVIVYNSRNTKNPVTGRAYLLSQRG